MRITYRRLIGLLCIGYALYVFAEALMAAESHVPHSVEAVAPASDSTLQ